MDRFRLDGRVAVVTGASRAGGIGRAICRRFAEAGAKVVISDVGPERAAASAFAAPSTEALDEAVAELESIGAEALGVRCDVTDAEDVERLVQAAVARFGRVDIFVNNAGIAVGSVPLVEVTERNLDAMIAVNLKGAYLGTQAAARQMIAQGDGGRIINTASQAGKSGWPLLSVYSATKFAVIGMTQSAAKELGAHGITVNAVCPGTVDTELSNSPDGIWEMNARALGISREEVRAGVVKDIPLGRFQTPDDVADAFVFLASDAAGYITGEAMNSTGGQEMH